MLGEECIQLDNTWFDCLDKIYTFEDKIIEDFEKYQKYEEPLEDDYSEESFA